MNKAELNELKKHKPIVWLKDASLNWLLIISVIALSGVMNNVLIYLLALLVIGSRQHSLSNLGHDGSHWLVCKNKTLNDLLTKLFVFWPMGITLNSYRDFHFSHHSRVGSMEDPELEHKIWASPEWDLPRSSQKKIYLIMKDLLGFSFRNLFKLFEMTAPKNVLLILENNLIPIFISLALLVTGNYFVLLLWYGSLMTSYWLFFRLRVWTEHMGTSGTHRIGVVFWKKWLFLPVNTWCHWEHHKWPKIPYYHLPAARALETKTPIIELKDLELIYANSEYIPSGYPLVKNLQMSQKKINFGY